METWRAIKLREIAPYPFQSLREVLTLSINRGTPNTLILAQPSGPLITVGSRTNVNNLVNLVFCREAEIPVIRTSIPHKSHGFYDSHICRCILAVNKETYSSREILTHFYGAIIVALENLDMEATHPPDSNNIMIGERKLSVSSIGMFNNAIILSCSLPLDFNYDLAQGALISPKDMRAWVTTINKEAEREVSVDELWDALKQGFQSVFQVDFDESELTEEEKNLLETMEGKYKSETWFNSGQWSPVKDYWRPT